jgi:hypothetical protein
LVLGRTAKESHGIIKDGPVFVTRAPVVRCLQPVLASVEASQVDLGAVLIQARQPVGFLSTTLTPTQRLLYFINVNLLSRLRHLNFSRTQFDLGKLAHLQQDT